jgi:hypothetical protein
MGRIPGLDHDEREHGGRIEAELLAEPDPPRNVFRIPARGGRVMPIHHLEIREAGKLIKVS